MHLTLTNDDGYDAIGLATLARVARELGTIDIVAPLAPQSQTSHSATLGGPLRIHTIEHAGLGTVTAVDGRPADCTRIATAGLAGGPAPDWVLSGINNGANLGVDRFYSGTVAAAREAAMHGIPAAAFSQLIMRPQPIDWDGAAIMAGRALRELVHRGCPAGTLWNVNLPAIASGFESVPIIETPVDSDPLPLIYVPAETEGNGGSDEPGNPTSCYRYAVPYPERPRTAGTDIDVTFSGAITIARLTVFS